VVYIQREVYRRYNDSSSPTAPVLLFSNPAIDYCPSQLYIIIIITVLKSDYTGETYNIIFYTITCVSARVLLSVSSPPYTLP